MSDNNGIDDDIADRAAAIITFGVADGIDCALQSLFGGLLRPGESLGRMLLEAHAKAGGGSRSSAAEELGALVRGGMDSIASSIRGHASAVETIGEEFGRIADALETLSQQLARRT